MSAVLHVSLLLTVGIFGSMFARILIVTISKRFIHFYAASQRNGGYFYRDKTQNTVHFVFETINWSRSAVFVIKYNILDM
jgi:hypothetical protein